MTWRGCDSSARSGFSGNLRLKVQPGPTMRWRGWLGFACVGAAVALAYRGDWLAMAGAAVAVLVAAVLRFRRECAATRTALRSLDEMVALAGERAAQARR